MPGGFSNSPSCRPTGGGSARLVANRKSRASPAAIRTPPLVAICLAQTEQFVECYRTFQIGHAHTDVVESLHHVRWLRLLLRPAAKTSESGPTRRKPLSLFRSLKSSRSHLRRS